MQMHGLWKLRLPDLVVIVVAMLVGLAIGLAWDRVMTGVVL